MVKSIFSLIAIWVISASAFSTTDSKTVKIAAGEWAPFIGQELEYYGSVGKTIQDAFASQGYRVEFDFYPWKRAYQKTQEGEYVATAVWMFAEERTERFNFSDPVAQEQFVFFYKKGAQFEWESLEDLKGKHLGGGIGYSYGNELDAMINSEQIKMDRVAEPSQNFLKLKYGRIDLMPEEKQIGLHILNQRDDDLIDHIDFDPKPFLTNNSFMMFSKAHPEASKLLEIFNKGLAEIKQE